MQFVHNELIPGSTKPIGLVLSCHVSLCLLNAFQKSLQLGVMIVSFCFVNKTTCFANGIFSDAFKKNVKYIQS